jgi:hypothetical protein
VDGIWNGCVCVSTPGRGLFLTAAEASGHTGQSETFTVQIPLLASQWRAESNCIVLHWAGQGMRLQAQTNRSPAGLDPNHWFDYPGGTSCPVIIPLDPTAGSVFFRLTTP